MSHSSIPTDLVDLPTFLRKKNINVSRATASRMRAEPSFPEGFRLRPNLVLYSAAELEQFILSKRVLGPLALRSRAVL